MTKRSQTVDYVLSRGVENILPSKKGLASLMKKKKLILYQGFDPSVDRLHLGNLIGIRKLAQFQSLGHKAIFLIGDFTGMIGDPTDKKAARKKLTREKVIKNARDYQNQIKNVLRFTGPNSAEVLYNSEWLSKLTFEEVLELASNFTVQQMIERDFFQERIKKKKPIYLHEFLYPVMQGYDSLAMGVDLEIGGSDQLFNMLAGRTLMKAVKAKEKYVLTMKLLTDPAGKKMGKTEANTINLTDSPSDMFGEVMALEDSLIDLGIETLTYLSLDEVKSLKPMEAKKLLAFEVVKQVYKKEEKATSAKEIFEKTFQKGKPEYKKGVEAKKTLSATIAQIVGSTSQAKRLIKEGAVDIDGETTLDPGYKIKGGEKIKIGKKTFVRVKRK